MIRPGKIAFFSEWKGSKIVQEQAAEEEEIERERGKRVAFFKGIINSLNALVHIQFVFDSYSTS